MILPIKHTTDFSIKTLLKYKQGIVHSVYRRTINLSFDGQLLALQADDSPISPISFITSLSNSELEKLDIFVGDQVVVSKNKLTIIGDHENYSFRYGQANVFHTDFSPDLGYEKLDLLRTNIQEVISQVNTNGIDLIFNEQLFEDSPLSIQVASQRIETSKRLLNEGSYFDAAKELSRLIGLGTGLTPSGDDFLCGVLAGALILKMDQHPLIISLKALIKEHLQDTIDISAAFLDCALKNQFSLAVNSLSKVPSPEEIKANFLAIGHSSGIDTLCGVYFILDTLKEL